MSSDAADAMFYALQVIQGNHTMKFACYVFYGIQLYGTYISFLNVPFQDLPDGCYVYHPNDNLKRYWYLKDITPVLLEDVPKELRTLCLLMGI